MPGMMVGGKWKTERQWQTTDVRCETRFRAWVSADGSGSLPAAAGCYHLYIAWACPWAHRTAILRKLEGTVGLSAVGPFIMGEDDWAFYEEPGFIPVTVNGAHHLREVHTRADPGYTGRVTTPLLFDKATGSIPGLTGPHDRPRLSG
ncbi:MAG: hypothetical protein M3151_13895 [Actinomycetota bacterium]|nr:hypothetical protein [Actinomycetota bacterium]